MVTNDPSETRTSTVPLTVGVPAGKIRKRSNTFLLKSCLGQFPRIQIRDTGKKK